MTRNKLLLTATAAAVLAAFNPAFAGGGAKHGSAEDMSSPSAKTEQGVEQSASSPSESSKPDDINVGAGVSVDQNSGDTERNADATGSADIGASAGAGASSDTPQDEKRSVDQDKLTGLDRAHPAN